MVLDARRPRHQVSQSVAIFSVKVALSSEIVHVFPLLLPFVFENLQLSIFVFLLHLPLPSMPRRRLGIPLTLLVGLLGGLRKVDLNRDVRTSREGHVSLLSLAAAAYSCPHIDLGPRRRVIAAAAAAAARQDREGPAR